MNGGAARDRTRDGAAPEKISRRDSFFEWLIVHLAPRRTWVVLFLIIGAVVFSMLSRAIRWNGDLLAFFSPDSADIQSVKKATASSAVANALRLDVHFVDPAKQSDVSTLHDAAKRLAATLRKSGHFESVWSGVETTKLAAAYGSLLPQVPVLLSPDEQQAAIDQFSEASIRTRFVSVKRHLADPDGEFLLAQLRADPLNLGSAIQNRLKMLMPSAIKEHSDDASATYTARLDDGMLVASRGDSDEANADDDPHIMLVATPSTPPSQQKDAEATMAAVDAAIATLRTEVPSVSVWTIGAHRSYVENARHVIADVSLVSLAGTVMVAIAIACFFRSVRITLLCLIPPAIGVGITLGLAGVAHAELPLILLGFAGLLTGSTTDYPIQILDEARRLARSSVTGEWSVSIGAKALSHLFGPISMSVATSVTGFLALGLSDAPGLRALGVFVAAASIIIWLLTFLVLPVFLGPWVVKGISAKASHNEERPFLRSLARYSLPVAVSLVLFGVIYQARTIRFNTDPHALDGASGELHQEESAFQKVWGDLRNRALVLIQNNDADAALTQLNHVASYIRNQASDNLVGAPLSAESLLPDSETVSERSAGWQHLWTPERRASAQKWITDAAKTNGFKPSAFSGYINAIGTTEVPPAAERIRSSPASLFPGLIQHAESGAASAFTLALVVPSLPEKSPLAATAWIRELRVRFPGLLILSGQSLITDATERSRAEAERLAPWCALAILIPLWIYFRRLRRAWLVFVCLIIGFLCIIAAANTFSSGLNVLSLVPILFTLGVSVDYGIYAATDPAANCGEAGRGRATMLCAATTLLGSGSLLLASHPAIHWLGITLVAGIGGGFLTSRFVVAPIVQFARRRSLANYSRGKQIIRGTFRLALSVLLLTATLLLCIPPYMQFLLSRERPAPLPDSRPTINPQLVEENSQRYEAFNPATPTDKTAITEGGWMQWHPAAPFTGFWEIALRGTPANRGLALGKLASPIDVRIESEMLAQLDTLVPNEWTRWLLLRGVAANLLSLPSYISPDVQQELYASSLSYKDPHAYLAPTYPRILSYHALHDISQMLIDNPLIVPHDFACTGVVSLPPYSAKTDGHLFLGRVFDFEGGRSFASQKSLTYILPAKQNENGVREIPFAHVAWPGLAGVLTGINAERIALFLNAAATKDFARIGTPTILMARDILQHATSLDEAEAIIRRTPVFVSDIITVADGKTGHARVFEKSPARTGTYDVSNSAVVTNHLMTPPFTDDPVNRERIADGTTTQRNARARELLDALHNHVTPTALAPLLRDKKGLGGKDLGLGNRNAIDGLIACHAVIMDATTGELWIAGYPAAEGEFVGVNVLATLQQLTEQPLSKSTPASPESIPPDTIITDGSWDRLQQSRRLQEEAVEEIHPGDFIHALKAAKMSESLNDHFYAGHELVGRILLLQGNHAAAHAEFTRALELDPPYAIHRQQLQELMKQCEKH